MSGLLGQESLKLAKSIATKRPLKPNLLKSLFSDKDFLNDRMATLDNVTLAVKLIYKISSQNVEKLFERT